jgi:hypothetical protein
MGASLEIQQNLVKVLNSKWKQSVLVAMSLLITKKWSESTQTIVDKAGCHDT